MRLSPVLLALLLLPGVLTGSAPFHLKLASSTPAANDTARGPLTQIDLTFTQAVQLRYTSMRLYDGRNVEIRLASFDTLGTTGKSFRAQLATPLPAGDYTVRWQAAGGDGHVVEGTFTFVSALERSAAPPLLTAADSTKPLVADTSDTERIRDRNLSPIVVTVRWLTLAALLLAVGGVVFPVLVLARARKRAPDAAVYWQTVARVSLRVATYAAVAGLLLALPRLLLQSAALHGSDRMLDSALLMTMLRETSWGRGWLLHTGGGLVYLAGVRLAKNDPDYWWFGAVAIFGLAVAMPLSGHAAGLEQAELPSIVNDALHILLASAWLGTLAYVLAAIVMAIRSGADDACRAAAAIVRAFSPVALAGAGMALITGSISALTYLGPLSDLWTTSYGQALSLKLIAVMLAAVTGFYNWRTVTPVLGTMPGTQRLRISATTELMIAGIVLAITAVLVALPTP